jgi:hypothetical protein
MPPNDCSPDATSPHQHLSVSSSRAALPTSSCCSLAGLPPHQSQHRCLFPTPTQTQFQSRSCFPLACAPSFWEVLPRADGVAASRWWYCCHGQAALLPVASGVAGRGWCFRWPTALLPRAGGGASGGLRCCSHGPAAESVATTGRRWCFRRPAALLPWAGGSASGGRQLAATVRQCCFQRPGALLPWEGGVVWLSCEVRASAASN